METRKRELQPRLGAGVFINERVSCIFPNILFTNYFARFSCFKLVNPYSSGIRSHRIHCELALIIIPIA